MSGVGLGESARDMCVVGFSKRVRDCNAQEAGELEDGAVGVPCAQWARGVRELDCVVADNRYMCQGFQSVEVMRKVMKFVPIARALALNKHEACECSWSWISWVVSALRVCVQSAWFLLVLPVLVLYVCLCLPAVNQIHVGLLGSFCLWNCSQALPLTMYI